MGKRRRAAVTQVRLKQRKVPDFVKDKSEETPDIFERGQQLPEKSNFAPKNPLLIDIVVDIVFRYTFRSPKTISAAEETTMLQDVQSCRLVCKLWRERATAAFREVARPTTFGTPKPKGGNYRLKNGAVEKTLEKFMNQMEGGPMPCMIPASINKFLIEESICAQNSACRMLFSEFMEKYGPQIVELSFEADNLNDLYSPLENLDCLNMAKLKVLKVLCEDFSTSPLEYTSNFDFFPFLEALLEKSPNLKEFEFRTLDEGPFYNAEKERIGELFERIPSTVTKLDLQSRFMCTSTLKIISEKNLHVEELGLGARRDYASPYAFLDPFQFIQQYSSILKKIRLEGVYSKSFVKLPELKNVESLHVVDSVSVRDYYDPPSPIWIDSADKCFPNLRSLELDIDLSVDFTHRILQSVFKNFLRVQELSARVYLSQYGAHSVDSLLSGIPTSDCARVHQAKGNLEGILFPGFERDPSLLNLTELKKLKLVNMNPRCSNQLTINVSDTLIFSKMEALEELDIQGIKMTNRFQKHLASRLKRFSYSKIPKGY